MPPRERRPLKPFPACVYENIPLHQVLIATVTFSAATSAAEINSSYIGANSGL